jgi:hypothetical protein
VNFFGHVSVWQIYLLGEIPVSRLEDRRWTL